MPTAEIFEKEDEIALKCLENCSLQLKQSIKAIIKNSGFQKYILKCRSVSTNGGNFLGQLHEIDIKGQVDNEEKEINLFIKENVVLEKVKLFDVKELYSNEVFIYKNYADIVNNLQNEVGIPEDDQYKFAKAYEGTNDEMIILENMANQGFKTYYRMDVLSIEYAKLAVEQLAKFHALSFVVENKMPEYFNSQVKKRIANFRYDDDWKGLVTKICVKTAEMFDGSEREKILNFEAVLKDKYPKYYEARDVKCCLSHGDYRLSNILVKEIDGVPVEVLPLDFQIIQYGNPIIDFIYFIFLGTDQVFRRKHLDDLKDLYYSTLTRFLAYFDLDVENIYPREKFEQVYKESLDFGLMLGLISCQFIFMRDTAEAELQTKHLSDLTFNPHEMYRERIQGMIEDFTDWGYL